jgi:hypothetical protein
MAKCPSLLSHGLEPALKMDHSSRIHRQRVAVLLAVALAAGLLFVPLGKVSLVWTLHGMLWARKIALGLCALAALVCVVGRWRRELWLPLRIGSYTFAAVAVAFCIFRMVVLSPRTLPAFADDDPRAAPYYRKACDAGVQDACAALGACYWTGTCGLPKNLSQGLSLFQTACDGGDMGSCGQLGVCYESGTCGLVRDSERAVAYYVKACDGGEMGMCNNLGVCYYTGHCGLSKDDVRASALYDKACRGGDSGACHNLRLIKN